MNLPYSNILPIKKLSQCFNSTTNSYKYYWFYSLLQLIKQNKTETSFNSISIEMLVNVWYPNHYFKLNFGVQDKLGILANEALMLDHLELKINSKKDEITTKTLDFITLNPTHSFTKNLQARSNYVPYRFIRPWLSHKIKKENGLVDKQIKELATVGTEHKLPYYFEGKKLIFDKDWFNYFQQHLKIMEDFCLWNLLNYMQIKNPNVPNIAAKLFSPIDENGSRALGKQRKFWNKIIIQNQIPIQCIYSNQGFKKYSLDHFIPWSFVTHNQLWNLIPIPKSINSQKSNNLPNLDLYFEPFADLQFNAFHIGLQLNLKGDLEDYLDVFNADLNQIQQFSQTEFRMKLRQQIAPLSQIAANMGFTQNWIYQP